MGNTSAPALLRRLPAVDELLRSPALGELIAREGHTAVAEASRAVLANLRREILSHSLDDSHLDLALSGLADAIDAQLRSALAHSLQPVINATGVLLHTNLGRAPLSESALEHIRNTAATYSNLEFDLAGGERGKRDAHVQRLFSRLLNADSAYPVHTVVVNNCAAAVLLALNTLAEAGEVIVSRGELVEIGGSFRVPEIMAKSGATLREVGTTNRTRLIDYEKAINGSTRLLLRVHRSNFAIVGFTEQPSREELVTLGKKHSVPVMEDLGNGALVDLNSFGIIGEGNVADCLRAGVDVVTYSGDKLLGGPQAGMLSGREEPIARIRRNPLFRALRVDKLTYAALEATLLDYLRRRHDGIPALRMMSIPAAELRTRAESLKRHITNQRVHAEVVSGESIVGGGTAPTASLPTFLLSVECEGMSANELQARLRDNQPPIVARVESGRVLLDLRTVFPGQEQAINSALSVL